MHKEGLDYGQINPTGKSALARAREAYERLKELWSERNAILERARGYAQNLIDRVRTDWGASNRDREPLRSLDQGLNHAELLHGELNHTSKRIAERTRGLAAGKQRERELAEAHKLEAERAQAIKEQQDLERQQELERAKAPKVDRGFDFGM